MIKNFENYRKIQELAGGMTQWEKTYDDGMTALCVVDNNCTRAMVREAFKAQEAGVTIECFSRANIELWC